MDTGYESVIDASGFVWTIAAMLIHAAIVAAQLGLCVFLGATGIHNLFFPASDTPWLRRLGAVRIVATASKRIGGLRLGLATLLLLPWITGASFAFSFAACLAALALLLFLERGIPADTIGAGRIVRRAAMTASFVLAAFMLFEAEDGLDLGVELFATMQGWRTHEVDWQLANDVEAPKVGELAPDFELQDPNGETVVRLSDFRGKRPVALIFGSYT
ncbi:MAG: hypothetical protein JRG89_22470 [Deltaproteobacteria bacterium]|nr:hypothetical protein [Deltaproteobacteria bacterium]MBW2391175.1 hypothetical protein [Deltaproteobacteria bacterium]